MVDQLAQQVDGIAGSTIALLQRLMDLGHLGPVAFGRLRVDRDGVRLGTDGQFRLQPLLLGLQLHQLAPGDLRVDGPVHHRLEHRLDLVLDGG